jgi:Na+-driven multidrug efflux pump
MRIPMYANIGATIAHIVVLLPLVMVAGWDIWAISIASSVQFAMRYVITRAIILNSGKFSESTVSFFTKESLKNLPSQFSLSL